MKKLYGLVIGEELTKKLSVDKKHSVTVTMNISPSVLATWVVLASSGVWADELRGTNSNHISQVQNDIRQLKTAPKGGATSINNNSENSVNFVIIGDANENYVTVSDNTYGDTTDEQAPEELLVGTSPGASVDRPQYIFDNQCDYDIMVRNRNGIGNPSCQSMFPNNCHKVKSKETFTDKPNLKPALEIAGTGTVTQGNFDNQYSYGLPLGVYFNDAPNCPEGNLAQCNNNSLCYSTAGRSDNCYHDADKTCPDSAWKVKTHPEDPVTWCLTNDMTLGVVSAKQDNTPESCPSAPSNWYSTGTAAAQQPLCKYNNNLEVAAWQLPQLVLVEGENQYTPLNNTNADMVKTGRPGGAKEYQAAVNEGCGQFTTQKISGNYPNYSPEMEPSGRLVAGASRRKDHVITYEGDQIYTYKWDQLSGDQTPMMAGNVGLQCSKQVSKITVTFCPKRWEDGNCENWCKSDLSTHSKNDHCQGFMVDQCGGCHYCDA